MHNVVQAAATGHTRFVLQSPASPTRSPPTPPVIPQFTRHPHHTFTGTAPAQDAVIVVDPGKVQQTFEGWGTSLCWFANVAGAYPDPLRNYLADLLFDPARGLGLQIARYNIGGSGWGCGDVANFRFGANIESFWGPDGTWNWEADAAQRWMLLAARDRGATLFEAFSNSPPYWMTVSGRASGNFFPWLDNLQPVFYDHFVLYLTEVVRWYRDTHGITFRTVAPFNEPSTIYWWAGNNQEGCHFDAATQNLIIERLAARLRDSGLAAAGVEVSASDETSIDSAVLTLRGYSPAAEAALTQINTHSYLGSQRKELRAGVKAAGKRLWMSEFGCGSSPPNGMKAALELSSVILKDLNIMQANAWVYWQAIENSENGNWWGLMQVPFHTGRSVTLGKQFYCLMQYSRFIRGGATILASSQHKSVLIAQTSPQQHERQFVIVATNALIDYDVVHFDLSECGGAAAEALLEVFRTSVKEDCQRVVSVTVPTPLRFGCPLRPLSITTFVVTFQAPDKSLSDIV